jgi:hypothetical protein
VSNGSRVLPFDRTEGRTDRPIDGQTSRRTYRCNEATRRFSQLCKCADQWTDCTESHSITAHWRWTTTAVRHKTVYTIDFKYSLILGDILAEVYVKINSTPVTCRVPADRLAIHLHNGWKTDSGTEHFFWVQVSNPTKIFLQQVGARKVTLSVIKLWTLWNYLTLNGAFFCIFPSYNTVYLSKRFENICCLYLQGNWILIWLMFQREAECSSET